MLYIFVGIAMFDMYFRPIRAVTADGNYLKEVASDWYLCIWLDLGVKFDIKMFALLYINLLDYVC